MFKTKQTLNISSFWMKLKFETTYEKKSAPVPQKPPATIEGFVWISGAHN